MNSKQLVSLNSSDEYAAYIAKVEGQVRAERFSRPEVPVVKETAKEIETSKTSGDDFYSFYLVLPCFILMVVGAIMKNVDLTGFSMLFMVSAYIITALVKERYHVNIFGFLHTRVFRRNHYRQLNVQEKRDNALAEEAYTVKRNEWLKNNEENERQVKEILTAYNSRNPDSMLVFENSKFSIDTTSLSDLRINSIVDGFRTDALKL